MNHERDIRQDPLLLEARVFFEQMIESVGRALKGCYLERLDEYRRVELGLAGKGMKAWRAICHLFFAGFEEDAGVVLRSLVEVVADMYFISLAPEKRAERFRDFEAIHRLRWRKAGDRLLDLSSPAAIERLAIIDADIKKDLDTVLARQPEWAVRIREGKGLPLSWAAEGTATKFEKIGLALLYFNYMTGCTHSHPNIVALEGYFDWVDGRAILRVDSRQPKEAHAFADSCQFVHMAIQHLNEKLHLKLDAMLEEGKTIVERLLLSSREMLPGQPKGEPGGGIDGD
jgi:hypothetical protein